MVQFYTFSTNYIRQLLVEPFVYFYIPHCLHLVLFLDCYIAYNISLSSSNDRGVPAPSQDFRRRPGRDPRQIIWLLWLIIPNVPSSVISTFRLPVKKGSLRGTSLSKRIRVSWGIARDGAPDQGRGWILCEIKLRATKKMDANRIGSLNSDL